MINYRVFITTIADHGEDTITNGFYLFDCSRVSLNLTFTLCRRNLDVRNEINGNLVLGAIQVVTI